MEHVHQGLTHHGIQGDDDQHGHQAPQAAAAHGYALFLVHSLNGRVLALGIVGIAALDLLHPGLKAGHLHHALLGFGRHGQHHQLHDDGEQDQRDTIVVGKLIQPAHQIAEGDLDDISKGEQEHGLSSLFFEVIASWDGVIKVPMVKRVAFGDPLDRQPAAADCPVAAYRLIGIGRAGGAEPAPGRKCGGNVLLIKSDQAQQCSFHGCSPASRRIPALAARFR